MDPRAALGCDIALQMMNGPGRDSPALCSFTGKACPPLSFQIFFIILPLVTKANLVYAANETDPAAITSCRRRQVASASEECAGIFIVVDVDDDREELM